MSNDDLQGQFIGLKAIVETFDKRLIKLESHFKGLSKRVKGIENQGLQNQIISFNNELLELSRYVTKHTIEYLEMTLNDMLYRQFKNNHATSDYLNARDYVSMRASAIVEKSKKSLEPLNEAKEYRNECKEYFRRHNLKGFAD
jgi:hypothetical protein